MTTVTVDRDAVIAERVAAWLAVGGSWDAMAVAHGAPDVDAFRERIAPHLTTSATARPPVARPTQLQLF